MSLKEKLTEAILDQIEKEREKSVIDRNLVRQLILTKIFQKKAFYSEMYFQFCKI